MQCLDFERIWNEQLDAREGASAELEQALEAHAAGCPACRQVGLRYQTLRQVLRTVAVPPAPSAELSSRVLRACALEQNLVRRGGHPRKTAGWLALAASLLLMGFVGWRTWFQKGVTPPVVAVQKHAGQNQAASSPPTLTDALAVAGSATWDFARESSAPAARLGREFLGSATLGEPALFPELGLALSLPEAGAEKTPRSVEESGMTRVLPFSGTARHAFGFLLGSPGDSQGSTLDPSKSG